MGAYFFALADFLVLDLVFSFFFSFFGFIFFGLVMWMR